MRVGIEVGGTFTDLVAVDGSRVEVIKVPSTPASPDKGAFTSLEAAGPGDTVTRCGRRRWRLRRSREAFRRTFARGSSRRDYLG